MKDIKTFLIGFLTCACLFLIMGQTESKVMNDIRTILTENGRYLPIKIGQNEQVLMMDSKKGELYFPSKEGWKLDMKK